MKLVRLPSDRFRLILHKIAGLSTKQLCIAVLSASDSHDVPHILWNPKVHCRVYRSPPFIHKLSHINPLHVPLFYLLLYFAVTDPSILGSSYLQVSSLFIFSPYVQHVLPIPCSFCITLLVFGEAYKVMKLHMF